MSTRHPRLCILVAPDKFKGSLNSHQAGQAIRRGWLRARPCDEVECIALSDGGEGFLDAMECAAGGHRIRCLTTDPLERSIDAEWLAVPEDDGFKAIIESSRAIGLHLMRPNERDPLHASSAGLGSMILDAARRGAREIIVGLGGSGTNDGGIGMASSLGFQFLDPQGRKLTAIPASLEHLARIVPPESSALPPMTAATDVSHNLTGPCGATRVFGPQKGVTDEIADRLDDGLARLADRVKADLGIDAANLTGSGAAGGLGFGMVAFCGATIISGFELIAQALVLNERIGNVDLVITGEGRLDGQSLAGKAPVALARLSRAHGKRIIALPGETDSSVDFSHWFDLVLPLSDLCDDPSQRMNHAAKWLEKAACLAAGRIGA
jgi:glycerate kinase